MDLESYLDLLSPSTQGFLRGVLDSLPTEAIRAPLQDSQGALQGDNNSAKSYMSRLQSLQSRYGFKSQSPEKKAPAAAAGDGEETTDDLTNKYKDRLKYLQNRCVRSPHIRSCPCAQLSRLSIHQLHHPA